MSAISPLIQQMREPLEPTPREAAIQKNAGSAVYGKDVARAMRDSLTGENSLEVPAGNDTVTISEEGRALRERMAAGKEKGPDGETVPGAKERVHTGIAGMSDDDGMTAAQR
ncbi:MAG: hypothetical protein LIP28_05770, partial [Deltaproteobacteria bacterium]|nr:hypothetical protein [Deltaproteobacteria bacterium]